MSHFIFKIVAEYPEKKHVATEVRPAAMHKHGSKKSKVNGNIGYCQAGHFETLPGNRIDHYGWTGNNIIAGNNFCWNGCLGKHHIEVISHVLSEHKCEYIDSDQ